MIVKLATKPYDGPAGARPCGYGCKKPWWPWAGTVLLGHANCALPIADQDEILALFARFPGLTVEKLSHDLGLPANLVRAWKDSAARRPRYRKKLRAAGG